MKIKLHLTAIFLFSAGMILTPSCVSMQHALDSTPRTRLSQPLPPLEIAADNGRLGSTDGAEPDDALHVLERELRQNVLEPTDTATFGYAKLTVTEARVRRTHRGLQAFQMATLLLPSLLGVPLETYRSNVTVELQLLDAQGQEIGCYAGYGSSKVRVAMYHGYSQSAAPRLSDVLALRGALARIRPQLDSAAGRVRPRLLSVGPVDNPTLPAPRPAANSVVAERTERVQP